MSDPIRVYEPYDKILPGTTVCVMEPDGTESVDVVLYRRKVDGVLVLYRHGNLAKDDYAASLKDLKT